MDREIVLQTVKSMIDADIDEDMIRDTLSDSGLSKAEIEDVMSELKGKKPRASASPMPPTFHEEIAQKTADKVKEHFAEIHEESAMRDTMTHTALEEHSEAIGKVKEHLEDLHEKIDTLPEKIVPDELSSKIKSLEKQLNKFEKDLGELKAANSALQSLLQKILQTDREILIKLEKKK